MSFAQYVAKNSIIRHFPHHHGISQDFRCQYQVLYSNLVWWLITYYWLIFYYNKSSWPKFFTMSLHHFYSTAPMSSNWQRRNWSSLRPEAAVVAVSMSLLGRFAAWAYSPLALFFVFHFPPRSFWLPAPFHKVPTPSPYIVICPLRFCQEHRQCSRTMGF